MRSVIAPLDLARLGSALVVALAAAGCSSSDSSAPADVAPDASDLDASTGDADASTDDGAADAPHDVPAEGSTTFGGARPVKLRVPSSFDPAKPAPLVILLHGYGAGGQIEEYYMKLSSVADAKGFFFAAPDGTVDSDKKLFWNAGGACCDFGSKKIDDQGYLMGLVHDIEAAWPIDTKRVYFVGHSNGAFMAHALACEHADEIAAIVSLAGAAPIDPSTCNPTAKVGVLQIHGDADDTISFDGGTIMGVPYPSVAATMSMWATKNGCGATPDDSSPPFDLTPQIAGDETTRSFYPGCAANGAAELWKIAGGGHIPTLAADYPERVWAFLDAHAKP